MLRTKFKSEQEERAITHNLRKEDLLFVHTAPHMITTNTIVKFQVNRF